MAAVMEELASASIAAGEDYQAYTMAAGAGIMVITGMGILVGTTPATTTSTPVVTSGIMTTTTMCRRTMTGIRMGTGIITR